MKPNGLLDLNFADADSLYFRLFPMKDRPVKFRRQLADNGKTYGICNTVMMSNRLKAAGFKIESSKKTNRHWSCLFFTTWVKIIAVKLRSRV